MKKLIPALFLASWSTLSVAADLPSRKDAPVYVAPTIAYSWTGFYFGGTMGYAFNNEHEYYSTGNNDHVVTAIATGGHPQYISTRSNGFTGGGEIGFNYQFANSAFFGPGGVVAGVEADIQYVGPGASATYIAPAGRPISHISALTNYVGTVRGRLGYAFDNILVYGTGGWAYGATNDNYSALSPINTTSFNRLNSTPSGYAVGGGVAYALPIALFGAIDAVILKAEYLYYNLGSYNMFVQLPVQPNSLTAKVTVSGNLIRAGIDFKFGSGSAPASVVAKY